MLKVLRIAAIVLLWPVVAIGQQAGEVWEDFVSSATAMQAKPVAFTTEKKAKSLHPLKKEGEYHYLLHYEVIRKEGKVFAELMYTDLLKGNFINKDTSGQKFAFRYPDIQLNELLKSQFRNPSASFDTVYNEKSYQAFHANLVRNNEPKKATLFVNKKTGQLEILLVTNFNQDKPVVPDLPANLRFSFTRIKEVFTLTESNYHFIEKNKGILYMKTINNSYLF